jgi:peptide/nickel transport system permease protein
VKKGGALLVVLALVALVAPLAAPYAPDAIDLASRRAAPSLAHWFGTDDLGRDVLSRALFGGRVSIAIGLLAVLSMPRLLLLMVAAATLQPSVPTLVLLVGVVGWMETARVTRASVRALAGSDYVTAALAVGAGHVRIVWRHVLANAAGAIRTAAVLAVGRAILVESALSFFGVGVQPPDATWGSMLYQAQSAMTTEPWLALFPGACIVLTVGGLTLVADRS